jgi:regulator of RNase E activity RraA
MTKRATFLGAKGTVVDGRVRDIEETRDMKYPVRVMWSARGKMGVFMPRRFSLVDFPL